MKNRNIFVIMFVVVSMMVCAGLLPVYAGPAAPVATKRFTPVDIKKAKGLLRKPQLVLSWEARAKLANDALARDAAAVKTSVDGVLERANHKYADCSAKDYTVEDLQKFCQPNEGVQECLNRLMMLCMAANNAMQWADAVANMTADQKIKTSLANMKQDITNLENALFSK